MRATAPEPCEAQLTARLLPEAVIPYRGTRHSLEMLEDGYGIRTIQYLLGYRDEKTMMMYTHVLNRGGKGFYSPMDRL